MYCLSKHHRSRSSWSYLSLICLFSAFQGAQNSSERRHVPGASTVVTATENLSESNEFDAVTSGGGCEGKEDNVSVLLSSDQKYCRAKDESKEETPDPFEQNIQAKIELAEAEYKGKNETLTSKDVSCSIYLDLISKDLERFREGITKNAVDSVRNRGILYQVRNGRIYRQANCNFPARCSGVEYFLKRLGPLLPDMELVINVSDWPQISSTLSSPLPVFSFSKSSEYADITYPAWTFWEGGPSISVYPKGIGRWDLMRKKLISAAGEAPWEKKKTLGFFRGSRTSNQRDSLILLSRKHPELVDAQYTKNQAWKSDADTLYASPASEVRMEEHCAYKYLFNFRGVAASFRYKHLFLCRSLVFHADDGWIEFFYPQLKPWIHFVPLSSLAKEDEIRLLLQFFNKHNDLAEKIAARGYQLIKSKLKIKDIECYWKQLLTSYASLIRYNIQARQDLIPLR